MVGTVNCPMVKAMGLLLSLAHCCEAVRNVIAPKASSTVGQNLMASTIAAEAALRMDWGSHPSLPRETNGRSGKSMDNHRANIAERIGVHNGELIAWCGEHREWL